MGPSIAPPAPYAVLKRVGLCALVVVAACHPNQDDDPPTTATTPPANVDPHLTVHSPEVTAGQVFTSAAPFVLDFTVPEHLTGGGLPTTLKQGTDEDRSLLQLEFPYNSFKNDEEQGQYIGSWSTPKFCDINDYCPFEETDGFWYATWHRDDVLLGELQMSRVTLGFSLDEDPSAPETLHSGVWLPKGETLLPGDRIELAYVGPVPKRATDWIHFHARYRSNPDCPAEDDPCWTLLDDSQVDALNIHAEAPAFVHAIAPLDVQAGVPFPLQIVVTDAYGNPSKLTDTIELLGDHTQDVSLTDVWRTEIEVTYDAPGDKRIMAEAPGLRGVFHWTAVTDQTPASVRQVGDAHFHTGDGGAQRKFLRSFSAGDHAGMYTRSHDALRYLDEVVGFDFGAPSEHAIRDDAYVLPQSITSDPAFQPGGACDGVGTALAGVGNWWPLSQQISRDYDGDLITFPAFEWHARHSAVEAAHLHRVVLFRDHHPTANHPMIPGDIPELPAQCIVRFAIAAGLSPDEVLILPHMMTNHALNIDWNLAYEDTYLGDLATREDMEAYQPVAEIFSARNDALVEQPGLGSALIFEGEPIAPAAYTFRYAWREMGVHIGVIAGSDSHSQMPGVNDETGLNGSEYHLHEPGGHTVAIAASPSRDGIYDALQHRQSYGTTGSRVWLDYTIDGAPMGSEISTSAPTAAAALKVMAGMQILRVELWAAPVGDGDTPYAPVYIGVPHDQVHSAAATLDNPVLAGASAEEWLYYTRALMVPLNDLGGTTEAVWSSPIWVTWSNPT